MTGNRLCLGKARLGSATPGSGGNGIETASGVQGSHWWACGQGGGCFLASHLKAHNSKAAGVVGGRDDGHQVGAVRNVLIVELDRYLVVT